MCVLLLPYVHHIFKCPIYILAVNVSWSNLVFFSLALLLFHQMGRAGYRTMQRPDPRPLPIHRGANVQPWFSRADGCQVQACAGASERTFFCPDTQRAVESTIMPWLSHYLEHRIDGINPDCQEVGLLCFLPTSTVARVRKLLILSVGEDGHPRVPRILVKARVFLKT